MEKVLLDTNFLVYLIKEKKFGLFEEFLEKELGKYKIYIFESTLAEIGNISKVVLRNVKLLLRNKKIEVIKEKGKVDELILKYKDDFVIATEDRNILEKVRKKIVKTKKYFLIEK